ncbi:MAG: MarR family transcriptional regulator [Candidatus Krumholzibacteriia bacterium]
MSEIPHNLDAMVGENLRILTQAIGDICQRSTLAEASGGKLTSNQFSILRILQRRSELTASEFARILGVSSAAVTKIIDRLAAMDLIAREAHPTDRRSTALVLQPAGRDLLQRHDLIASRKLTTILAGFSAEDKLRFLDFIQRVVRDTLSDEQDADVICYQCGGRCGESCVLAHRDGTCSLNGTGGD